METLKLDLYCPKCGYHEIIEHPKETVVETNCPKCTNLMTWRYLNNEKPKPTDESILDKAFKTINGDRQDSYGAPEDSFQIIASFWTTYLGHKDMITEGSLGLSTLDVAHMMTLFKIARMLGQKPKQDNYVDAIGYLAIAADRLSKWPEPLEPGL